MSTHTWLVRPHVLDYAARCNLLTQSDGTRLHVSMVSSCFTLSMAQFIGVARIYLVSFVPFGRGVIFSVRGVLKF